MNHNALSNDFYIKSDIVLNFSSLIGAAPAVLNTSVELATALGNDSNYATTIQNQLHNKSYTATTFLKKQMLVYGYLCYKLR